MIVKNTQNAKIYIIFFLFTITLVISDITMEMALFDNESKITALDNAEKKVFEREEFFKDLLNRMKSDILSLANSSALANFLKEDNVHTRKELSTLLYQLGNYHNDIAQLRYLDLHGMETIRMQRSSDNGFIFLPSTQLQDKSQRYYFIDAKNRKPNEAYFSAFDLNVEHDKVEIPFTPTLRVFTPIVNQQGFKGLLIVNYAMASSLKRFTRSPLYDVILADQDGHPLSHYDPKKSWGAYQKEKYSIKSDFPTLYKQILSKDFLRTDQFVSKKLNLDLRNDLYLILQFRHDLANAVLERNIKRKAVLTAIILIFSGVTIYFILRVFRKTFSNYHEIQTLNEKLQEQSHMISEHSIFSQTDLKGVITDVSQAFCELSGYHRDELIGKPHNIVRHPDMPASTYKKIWENLKNGESWDGEIINRKKDGNPYWVYSSIAPHYDENHQLIGYVSTRVNITSEKELERQDQLLKQQEKLALLGEMFGNIAHQWRQPLNIISTIITQMRFKAELETLDPDSVTKYTESVQQSIQYLTDTISTFKNFIQDKKVFKKYPIQDEIDKALTITKPMLKDNNITLIHNLDTIEKIDVSMITNELSQVLMVLLNNAKDALKEHNIQESWIKLELSQSETSVLLTIEDNAGGIPDKIMPNLFVKYFTTKADNKGTGLGLYMSKEIIEDSLGGKFYVQNSSHGAKFFIELPL